MTGQADVIVVTEDAERSRDVISGIEPYHNVGTVALEALEPEAHPDCLLYVIDCPVFDREVVALLQALHDHPATAAVPCIYVLNAQTRRDIVRVKDLGAADYFVRPIDARKFLKSMSKQITGAVERSWDKLGEIERAALKVSLKSFEDAFSAFGEGNPPDTEAVKESSNMVVDAVAEGGFETFIASVRNHHNYTFRHSMSVSTLLVAFGRAVGASAEDQRMLALGGVLHDIGMAYIPAEILDKPGRLNEEEWVIVRQHPVHSWNAIAEFEEVNEDVGRMAYAHHEKLDGSGYPEGWEGEQIPDLVRMVSIVDVYASMIDKRVYRPPVAPPAAITMMMLMEGHLDMGLVQVFDKQLLN